MSNNVEVVVPDATAKHKMSEYLGQIAGVRLETEPTKRVARRIFAVWLDALNDSAGRQRLAEMLSESRGKDDSAVFVLERSTRHTNSASFLQALALLSSWAASHRHVDPYIAPDFQALRRLVIARRANAEDRLIASASLEDDKLVVWSCEPRRFEIPVFELPALASMSSEAVKRFELSESGSRLHWAEGDVDLDLETLRAFIDPDVRRDHETQRRAEAKRYASAIRKFRIERGLKQNDIEGLSERQIRRLEEGENLPRSGTIALLAAAHQLTANEYLSELAKRFSGASRPRREKKK